MLIEKVKVWFINSPPSHALWFVYIWMRGKEEWVLVYLGPQHKSVEQPVQPMFPDCLSVSCDYGVMKKLTEKYLLYPN